MFSMMSLIALIGRTVLFYTAKNEDCGKIDLDPYLGKFQAKSYFELFSTSVTD